MWRLVTYLSQWTLVRFVLTGLLNTAVGLGIIFALKWFLGWGDTAANLMGYGIGLMVSYVVNSRWTFGYRESLLPVLPQYLGVIGLAYLSNLACVHFLIEVLHLDSYLAQTLGVIPYAGLTFVLLRIFVFRSGK